MDKRELITFSKLSWSLIRDPIYNYIDYNKAIEKPVIDSRPMQRLRWLRQLQLAHLVYPGADHTRFQHSLGVMHLAGLFAEHLVSELSIIGDLNGYKRDELIEIARLAGLLHDVGHGPFSHAFEEAIYWNKKDLPIPNHEVAGLYIIKYSEIGGLLNKYGLLDSVLAVLGESKPEDTPLALIRNTIKEWIYPADVMDFLLRDSYYTGTREYGIVDYERLIKLSHVNPADPSSISLEEKAVSALLGYLRNRIAMFENVYIHPVSAVFSHTASLLMKRIDDLTNKYSEAIESLRQGDPEKYLSLTDYSALIDGLRIAKEYNDEETKVLVNSILSRKPLWKLLYEEKITINAKDLLGFTASLLLRQSIELSKHIEEKLYEKLDSVGLGSYRNKFWISLSTLKPTPPVPGGYIQLCRVYENTIVNTKKVFIPELLEKEGIKLKILIRVYAPRELIKDPHRKELAEKIAKSTILEFITPRGLFTGITM